MAGPIMRATMRSPTARRGGATGGREWTRSAGVTGRGAGASEAMGSDLFAEPS